MQPFIKVDLINQIESHLKIEKLGEKIDLGTTK
jgi:hypothetical protein